eukprot:scaffold121_cov356-Pavlova_lutheri.AAC.9
MIPLLKTMRHGKANDDGQRGGGRKRELTFKTYKWLSETIDVEIETHIRQFAQLRDLSSRHPRRIHCGNSFQGIVLSGKRQFEKYALHLLQPLKDDLGELNLFGYATTEVGLESYTKGAIAYICRGVTFGLYTMAIARRCD